MADDFHHSSTPTHPEYARDPKRQLIIIAVVMALIAFSFSLGYFRGTAELRRQQAALQARDEKASANAASRARELEQLKALQVLWQVDAGVSDILVHLYDKNYGMARDAARQLSTTLDQTTGSLDEQRAQRLSPLRSMLDSIAESADSLSPQAVDETKAAKAAVMEVIQDTSS